ncbi:hypothetical protein BDV96DRAFT_642657 [Lophiotrema nucula]|uniref:2EXR domain-containing protein n=1 Tax=Lophiotrema nucula TaxID=690887 RepID=A0A6A5ZN51_9PLEO|nr:hypothetical protein BDV96DRAFT_642657 [Lophiotrema nucula]
MSSSRSPPSPPARLRMLNRLPDVKFPLFQRLPKELRIEVWVFTLTQQERLVKIHLYDRNQVREIIENNSNEHGRPLIGIPDIVDTPDHLFAVTSGSQVDNTLFRINQESRDEFQRRYRVRIPCLFNDKFRRIAQASVLFINPKCDILFITYSEYHDFLLSEFIRILKSDLDPEHIGLQATSDLFDVNKESRGEASRFYRVCVPCTFQDDNDTAGVLRVNPDYDFLFVTWVSPETINFLPDFIYLLQQVCDPQKTGLLHLALSPLAYRELGDLICLSSVLKQETKTAFASTMANLHEFWSAQGGSNIMDKYGLLEKHPSRISIPPPRDTGRLGENAVNSGWAPVFGRECLSLEKATFYWSYPIMPTTLCFGRVGRDLRAISHDLGQMSELRRLVQRQCKAWLTMLSPYYDIVLINIKCQILLSSEPQAARLGNTTVGTREVSNRTEAENYLIAEEDTWHAVASERYNAEELDNAPRPTLGFWLLPAEIPGERTSQRWFRAGL